MGNTTDDGKASTPSERRRASCAWFWAPHNRWRLWPRSLRPSVRPLFGRQAAPLGLRALTAEKTAPPGLRGGAGASGFGGAGEAVRARPKAPATVEFISQANQQAYMGYIQDLGAELERMLETTANEEDRRKVVEHVKKVVLESYRNGLEEGRKGDKARKSKRA